MFTFFEKLRLIHAISKAIKEVKKFLEENSDKVEEVKKGIELIKEGLQLIVKQVPAVNELFLIVRNLLSNLFKKGK